MEQFLIFDNVSYPVLSMLVFTPILGAIGLFFINSQYMMKIWGLFITLLTAVISIPLYTNFDSTTAKYQFAEVYRWFPTINLNYSVGIDGISILLVILTTFVMPLCILCSWNYIDKRIREFLFAILIMESAMIGVFISLNTVLFYIFWEAMLIPMYLLIAVWGGPRKDYASIKFFLYTLIASVFLLVAIIALYINTGTFFIPELMGRNFSFSFQIWVFLACALAFAVKIPMFPLHTWLPAAHVEAPTAGSVILASVLLKMGGYGFIRFCLPITPLATEACVPYLIALSLASIIFGGYLALGQNDIKKLIAYSSVGHMGFVTLGIFVLNSAGIKGAMLQMINHGITTGALFICIGIIYERTHSRDIKVNSALGMFMPVYVTFLGIFSLSSLAFPGTNSFVGEFLVLLGAFSKSKLVGAIAIPGAVLAAAYMLRLLQKMVWADSDGHKHGDGSERGLFDLDLREKLTLAFLTVFVFWIGLNPEPLLNIMDESINHLLIQYNDGISQAVESSEGLHHALRAFKGFIAG
ncbi:MAG: NADH-quinone oxidoreductase subunit M [Desulfobacteraceae bacterium]|nr:NADH-quinone oxidoreductase subunit M [Desulfobacteraceae bacterium]